MEKEPLPTSVSRRRWLALASTSAAVSVASGAGVPSTEDRTTPSAGAKVFDVRVFGARGDGKTLDTAAVQAAIDACHRDQGGVVLVPAGVFVIGTVELKSNVTLRIAATGKLLGS